MTKERTAHPSRKGAWRALTLLVGTAMALSLVAASIGTAMAAPPTSSNPAVDLDQCRNGGLEDPQDSWVECEGNGSGKDGWVNGNAGASNAHYAEGESISYRARITGLAAGDDVVLIMGYDVVHGGHMALDYLTSNDRWQQPEVTPVGSAPDSPCSSVSPCDPGDPATFAIPEPETNLQVDVSKALNNGCQVVGTGATQQPKTSFNALPAAQRAMEFFNADPSDIQYFGTNPTLTDKNGDQEQQIAITFEATASNPVLSWGAHIASRLDWGCVGDVRSAEGISGSPYHMRIKSINVNGKDFSIGNQDRSLSAAAVIFVQPGLSTTPNPTSGTVGVTLNDSATLTGGLNPTGSITFKLWPPSNPTCDPLVGAPVFTQAVGLNGLTTVSTTGGYQTITTGTYRWTADYPGDGTNAPASSGCTAEQVVISPASPTVATTQSLIPNDTFTLSGAFSPTGSVQFYLFAPATAGGVATCPGDPAGTGNVYSQLVPLTGSSASTTNTGTGAGMYTATTPGTYKWYAHWPGDTNNNSATSNCVETFTINNG